LKYVMFLCFCISLFGCAQTTIKPHEIDRQGVDTIYYGEGLRATFIKTHGNPEHYCGSRESDVAESGDNSLSLGLGLPDKTETVSEQSGAQLLTLGGRSPSVLIARELMYRACELSSNVNASPEETLKIYKMFLDNLSQLYEKSSVETGTNSTGISDSASNEDDYKQDQDDDSDNSY